MHLYFATQKIASGTKATKSAKRKKGGRRKTIIIEYNKISPSTMLNKLA